MRADEKHLYVREEGGRGNCRKSGEKASQEVGKTTLYCAGFLSGGINEIFFRKTGSMGWKRDERHEMSQLWQKGSKDRGITAFCVAVGIY